MADEPQQALIGNWAHTWHPAQEQGEFEKSHGRKFEERQHILRLRGQGPFTVLIVPYRKGEQRPEVKAAGDKLLVDYEDGPPMEVSLD